MSRHWKTNSCVYCGDREDLTVDHVVPVSRWKEFHIRRRQPNNSSNTVVCCRRCNQEKADLAPHEWFQKHPEYYKRFKANARYLSDRVKSICGLA